MEVVGEAGSALEAIGQVSNTSPDVVLMDLEMTDIGGLEATRILKNLGYEGAVIALSSDDRRLDDAIDAGAFGYMLKDAPTDEVVEVVRRVPEGGAGQRQDVFLPRPNSALSVSMASKVSKPRD